MGFVQVYIKEITAVIVPFIIWLLNYVMQPRTRLVQSVRHSYSIVLQEPANSVVAGAVQINKLVRAASIQFVNTGSGPATDVQITFNWRPQHFDVWPSRHYTEATSADGRFTIKAGNLPPKGIIGMNILSVDAELPQINSAQCDECTAKIVELMPQEVHPRWKLLSAALLMFIGFVTVMYFSLTVIQLIASSLPSK